MTETDWALWWRLEGFYAVFMLILVGLALALTLSTRARLKPRKGRRRRRKRGARRHLVRLWWLPAGAMWVLVVLTGYSWLADTYFLIGWAKYAWEWLLWAVGSWLG